MVAATMILDTLEVQQPEKSETLLPTASRKLTSSQEDSVAGGSTGTNIPLDRLSSQALLAVAAGS